MSSGYYYFDRMGNEIDERTWDLYSRDPMYSTVAVTEIETEGVRIMTIWSGRTRSERTPVYSPVIFGTTVMVDDETRRSYETDSDYVSGGNTSTEAEAFAMHERAVEMAYLGTFREQVENVIGPERFPVPDENPCEEVRL